MKKKYSIVLFALVYLLVSAFYGDNSWDRSPVYVVKRLKGPMSIDGNWDKAQWKKIKEIPITNYMGDIPSFRPAVRAKMMYDKDNLYLIYKVDDRHVRIQNDRFNSSVSTDACVEFFFSPDKEWPLRYFNVEINAGGTALMAFQKDGKRINMLEGDFKDVMIAHTLPRKLDQEISEPVTWFLEFKMPLALLKKYSNITLPEKGVAWKANFYKTSSKSTNPHYLTWAVVHNLKPQFHLPQFFGTLIFK